MASTDVALQSLPLTNREINMRMKNRTLQMLCWSPIMALTACGNDYHESRGQSSKKAAATVEQANESTPTVLRDSEMADQVDPLVAEYASAQGIDINRMTVINEEKSLSLFNSNPDPEKDPRGYVISQALALIVKGIQSNKNLIATYGSYSLLVGGQVMFCTYAQVVEPKLPSVVKINGKTVLKSNDIVMAEIYPPSQDNESCRSPQLLMKVKGMGASPAAGLASGGVFIKLFGNNFAAAVGAGVAACEPNTQQLFVGGIGAVGVASQTFNYAAGSVGGGSATLKLPPIPVSSLSLIRSK
jgi:hypothetical protein